jgi:transposase
VVVPLADENNNNQTDKETDMKDLMAGIDLHSNNIMTGLVDREGRRVAQHKLPCQLPRILEFLAPYKERLHTLAVESTYNWYWLVDGLQAAGYSVVLANPAKITQYNGLKHADDKSDAFFLAELLRLNILPTGHVYDARLRPVRDLLRRRMSLVHQRTALMLSFKSLFTRTTGEQLSLGRLKGLAVAEAQTLYEHPANQLIAGVQIEHIDQFNASIGRLEAAVLKVAKELPSYPRLQTLPGVGVILGLTITMEIGEIRRFAGPGQFASYCRTVGARRTSNGKAKGENNRKCGNKYLAWALVEAANFAKRYDEPCRRWFERKAARTNNVIATKALACKLAKAAWHVVAQDTDYDAGRVFPHLAGAPAKLLAK